MVIPNSTSASNVMMLSPDKLVVFGSQGISKASPTPYSDATQVRSNCIVCNTSIDILWKRGLNLTKAYVL